MKKIDLILFDLDGTLIDSLDDLANATNQMLLSLGRAAVSREQVRGYVGQGARRLVERAMPDAATEEIERGLSLFLVYNEEHIVDRTRLYPGVVETLTTLRDAGLTLAVVSNKNAALCTKVLTTLEADGFFACVIGADSLPERKPSPEPLLKVLRYFAVPPERAVMVGDSVNDIAAGQAAGLATIGCTFGYGDLAEIKDADFLIDSLPELLKLPLLNEV
ncbi:MAG: HAD-IIIA family hydrolase [Geobacter sp.]|nr:MAG: HAD-IIIA family hydrolase [Geobacter sp.]